MKAAIIAIGTEVTSGQITNSHAQWISSQLDDFGIETLFHISVPDDDELILSALENSKEKADLIFVTGGLGPTSDDITRQVTAKWLKKDLIFHEDLWSELKNLLTGRKVKVSDGHKNQCYFPEGSVILRNSVGSAHGFHLASKDLSVWVLPGPIPELRAIWTEHISAKLQKIQDAKKFILKKWRCIGWPESELADRVEEALAGEKLKMGYRLATPYVEFKLWLPSEISTAKFDQIIEKVEAALLPKVVCRDSEDLGAEFIKKAALFSDVTLIDECTRGVFSERLFSIIRKEKLTRPLLRSLCSTAVELENMSFDGNGLVIRLLSRSEPAKWRLVLRQGTRSEDFQLETDGRPSAMTDRLALSITEISLKKILSWIETK